MAVEPVAINRSRLEHSAKLNDLLMTVFGVALSDRKGSIPMHRDDALGSTTANAIMGEPGIGYGETTNVAMTTLDALAEEADWPHVDVIKVDIEGAETLMLRGLLYFSRRADLLSSEYLTQALCLDLVIPFLMQWQQLTH